MSGLLKREARKRVAGPVRDALRRAAEQWCPECQKRVQPFHMCMVRTDFRQRRTAVARQDQRSRRGGNASGGQRGRRAAHDYQACTDPSCSRPLCRAFREGQQACPLPHQG